MSLFCPCRLLREFQRQFVNKIFVLHKVINTKLLLHCFQCDKFYNIETKLFSKLIVFRYKNRRDVSHRIK